MRVCCGGCIAAPVWMHCSGCIAAVVLLADVPHVAVVVDDAADNMESCKWTGVMQVEKWSGVIQRIGVYVGGGEGGRIARAAGADV